MAWAQPYGKGQVPYGSQYGSQAPYGSQYGSQAAWTPSAPAKGAAKGAAAPAAASEEYMMVTKVPTINGLYKKEGENHGRGTYKKQGQQAGQAPLLYYWQDPDPASSGWWIGLGVGGNEVWAHNPAPDRTPPVAGWKIPFTAAVDPTARCQPKPASAAPAAYGAAAGKGAAAASPYAQYGKGAAAAAGKGAAAASQYGKGAAANGAQQASPYAQYGQAQATKRTAEPASPPQPAKRAKTAAELKAENEALLAKSEVAQECQAEVASCEAAVQSAIELVSVAWEDQTVDSAKLLQEQYESSMSAALTFLQEAKRFISERAAQQQPPVKQALLANLAQLSKQEQDLAKKKQEVQQHVAASQWTSAIAEHRASTAEVTSEVAELASKVAGLAPGEGLEERVEELKAHVATLLARCAETKQSIVAILQDCSKQKGSQKVRVEITSLLQKVNAAEAGLKQQQQKLTDAVAAAQAKQLVGELDGELSSLEQREQELTERVGGLGTIEQQLAQDGDLQSIAADLKTRLQALKEPAAQAKQKIVDMVKKARPADRAEASKLQIRATKVDARLGTALAQVVRLGERGALLAETQDLRDQALLVEATVAELQTGVEELLSAEDKDVEAKKAAVLAKVAEGKEQVAACKQATLQKLQEKVQGAGGGNEVKKLLSEYIVAMNKADVALRQASQQAEEAQDQRECKQLLAEASKPVAEIEELAEATIKACGAVPEDLDEEALGAKVTELLGNTQKVKELCAKLYTHVNGLLQELGQAKGPKVTLKQDLGRCRQKAMGLEARCVKAVEPPKQALAKLGLSRNLDEAEGKLEDLQNEVTQACDDCTTLGSGDMDELKAERVEQISALLENAMQGAQAALEQLQALVDKCKQGLVGAEPKERQRVQKVEQTVQQQKRKLDSQTAPVVHKVAKAKCLLLAAAMQDEVKALDAQIGAVVELCAGIEQLDVAACEAKAEEVKAKAAECVKGCDALRTRVQDAMATIARDPTAQAARTELSKLRNQLVATQAKLKKPTDLAAGAPAKAQLRQKVREFAEPVEACEQQLKQVYETHLEKEKTKEPLEQIALAEKIVAAAEPAVESCKAAAEKCQTAQKDAEADVKPELGKLAQRAVLAGQKVKSALQAAKATQLKAQQAQELKVALAAVEALEAELKAAAAKAAELKEDEEMAEAQIKDQCAQVEQQCQALKQGLAGQTSELAQVKQRVRKAAVGVDSAMAVLQLAQERAELTTCKRLLNELKLQQQANPDEPLFAKVNASGDGKVTPAELQQFLKATPKDQALRFFEFLDAEDAGALEVAKVGAYVKDTFLVVKSVALSEEKTIVKSKILRQLELQESLELLEGPSEDQDTKLQRVKVRCASDQAVGWTTIQGNQGSTFLQPVERLQELESALAAKRRKAGLKRTLLAQAEQQVAQGEAQVKLLGDKHAGLAELELGDLSSARAAKHELQRELQKLRPMKACCQKGVQSFPKDAALLALQQRSTECELKVQGLLLLAEEAPKKAQERQAACEKKRDEALALLRAAGRSEGFPELAAAMAVDGQVAPESLKAKLASLGLQVSAAELKVAFAHFDRTGAGQVAEAEVAQMLQPRWACVTAIGISTEKSIGSKITRQLVVGEVLDGLSEAEPEEKTKVLRVKVRAADGTVGYVTIKGNQGTVYLEPREGTEMEVDKTE